MEGDGGQGDVGVAGFDEVPGWASDEDARHVSWIVFDEQPPVGSSDIRAESGRPVTQAKQMNAGRPQGALLLG